MQHIVIVGGRTTGIAAYVQLVRELPSGSRITVVDPGDADHPAVFGDPAPQLLSNTSAHIGSVIADRADDLLRFLPVGMDPHAVPRHLVGEYAASRFEQHRTLAAERGIRTTLVQGSATAVVRSPAGYLVETTCGDPVEATDVVLAMGPGPARHVSDVASASPYPTTQLLERPPKRALVVGMGPSGIDATLVLAAAGVPVHMVSRSGTFPAVRSRTLRFEPIALASGRRTLNLRDTLEKRARANGDTVEFHEPCPGEDPVALLERDIELSAPAEAPWQDALADIVYLLGSRAIRLTDEPKFVWRYLTSVMRSTAVWLHDYIAQGLVTTGPISETTPHEYPLVVSAVGFEPYPLFGSANRLEIGRGDAPLEPIISLDSRLRVTLPGRTEPERIWAIGPTAGLARMTSSSLCVAVAQSREVAHHIASRADRPLAAAMTAA